MNLNGEESSSFFVFFVFLYEIYSSKCFRSRNLIKRNIFIGMKVLIAGTIPLSAGLASSSALVVCGALTTILINEIHINKVYSSIFVAFHFDFMFSLKSDLAELCAECERYIGTQGGKFI